MRRAACLALVLPLAACRNAAEQEAAEIAGMRERAADGIVAVELYCARRDTALAATERGEPGAELLLEQLLLAPERLDDYCEEFRLHTHDALEPRPASEPAARDTSADGGGG